MKGLELPINVLILIAIAVIVLLAVIVLFFGGFGGPAGTVTLSTVTSTACADWRNRNFPDARTISTSSFDANKDGSLDSGADCTGCTQVANNGDNLEMLGECYYGTGTCLGSIGDANEQAIKTRVCGFP